MCRNISLLVISHKLRFVFLLISILSLHGCAVMKNIPWQYWSSPLYPAEKIERNHFSAPGETDVVGRLAVLKLAQGDTLPDVARHFSLGVHEISIANPGVDVWVPRASERIILPLSFILPDVQRKGIVINLAAMRLFHFKEDGSKTAWVSTYPIGIGSEEQPTPKGLMHVSRKMVRPTWHVPRQVARDRRKKGDILPEKVLPGPLNPLGEHALYLESSYLIHGTNKPASIGLRATNGCIRLYPEDVKRLYADTPVKTPVRVINQPYLVGRRNGWVYLEVHATSEDPDTAELGKMYAKLRKIETQSARPLDWKKVKTVLTEARGIPVPVFKIHEGSEPRDMEIIEVNHPIELYGKPKVPEMKTPAWYILSADEREEIDALRIAAMINHQGPQIPARVLFRNQRYLVIAGPFHDSHEAREALKRLKIDLEMEGILIEPR